LADAAYHGLLGAAVGAPMVKFALLAFSASIVLSEASARTRMRAWLVLSEPPIVQLKLRALGSEMPLGVKSFSVPAAGHETPPSVLNATL
jgi:hypothetical protein